MNYIWQHKNWPHFGVNKQDVNTALDELIKEEEKTAFAFSFISKSSSVQFRANLIAENIVSSLNIENESIDVDSVFSSVDKHLFIDNLSKDSSNAYSDNLVEMITDAFENKKPMTEERLLTWQKLLFENQAGLAKKVTVGFRKGPEYVIKNGGKFSEVIYEAVPAQNIKEELNKLLNFVNESEENDYVKAAVASLWFVLIHPFEDGNGRVSRALADYVIMKNSSEFLPLACISSTIMKKRKEYYDIINSASSQNSSLDITQYVIWFLNIVNESYVDARTQLSKTISLSGFIGSLSPAEFNSREMHMLYLLASGSFRGKITNEKWSKINKCSSTVAFRDIQHLVRLNFLTPSGEAGPKTGYYFNASKAQYNDLKDLASALSCQIEDILD